MTNFPVLVPVNKDFKEFVEFWSKFYDTNSDETKGYSTTITKKSFTEEDLEILFEWKNQMRLSEKKDISFKTKVLTKISLINEYKSKLEIDVEKYFEDFYEVSGVVWRIFLLHCIKPNEFPIYDQHVHRALLYMNGENIENVLKTGDLSNDKKLDYYKNEYLPFFQKFGKYNPKKFDEAMVSLGQHISKKSIFYK
ncbi:MAG: hypothetical protein EAZ27_13035 [Cytophagales bacterium]|nr:MAG: hypothetical protein EAZ27_13035 [Cytophagales bacterium]